MTSTEAEAIERGAAGGDLAALHQLALWRLLAVNGPRDLGEAHRLLERAAKKGHVESTRLLAMLVGNGTGCRSHPGKAFQLLKKIEAQDPYASLQILFSQRMGEIAAGRSLPKETLSASPLIQIVRHLCSVEECAYVRTLAEPSLEPSVVVDPASGRRIPHPVRTSSGMSFGPLAEDRVINLLNRRLAAATGTEPEQGEPLHVLRYAPGEQYRPHVDYLPGVANQRSWTVLVYLNEDYSGGETVFDHSGISFRGATGDALLFRNLSEDGLPDPATRHAGLPVTQGEKWLATRWIRHRRYHPWMQGD